MIALILAPVYLLLNFYILRWCVRWMNACARQLKQQLMKHVEDDKQLKARIRQLHIAKKCIVCLSVILYIVISTSLLTSFLLPFSDLQRGFKELSNYWLGTFEYILLTVLIVDMIRLILKYVPMVPFEKFASQKLFVFNGGFCIFCIAALSIWGIIHANHIQTTELEIEVPKSCGAKEELRIVLAADIHLGYSIGSSNVEQMVQKINAQNPDIVCIAGDIFDNEYEALDDPERMIRALRSIKSTQGVYACYGNHDIEERLLAGFSFADERKKQSDVRMDRFLEQANIRLLRDETILVNDAYYLIGRPDYEKPGRGIKKRREPEDLVKDLDKDKPILVLDHQPRQLQELADAGVDVALSGHTHNGQMFPGNLTVRLMWENAYGCMKIDNMYDIVTSGVGVFGPDMRVGTNSEIMSIRVRFT